MRYVRCNVSVSYTHLDVYKRQATYHETETNSIALQPSLEQSPDSWRKDVQDLIRKANTTKKYNLKDSGALAGRYESLYQNWKALLTEKLNAFTAETNAASKHKIAL